jgi:hypothetical protein
MISCNAGQLSRSHLPVTIEDICAQLDRFDDDGVIYAKRVGGEFTPSSEATVVAIPPDDLQTPAAEIAARYCPGLDYCLEVFIAKEAVEVWSRWRDVANATPAERARAVCYYANNDAWLPD